MSGPLQRWHEKTEFAGARRLTDGLLKRLGRLAWIPPNAVTIAGGLLVVPMAFAFTAQAYLLGTILFTASVLTDWLDGAMARYQVRRMTPALAASEAKVSEWWRFGPTEVGKKLDPVIDKARYFAALAPLGWDRLPQALFWTAAAIAVLLTFFREVVRWIWGLKPGANAYGKIKVYVEIGVIAFLLGWAVGLPSTPTLAVPAFAAALALVKLRQASRLSENADSEEASEAAERMMLRWGFTLIGAIPVAALYAIGWPSALLTTFIAATALGGVSLAAQGWSIRRQVKALSDELGIFCASWRVQALLIRRHLASQDADTRQP